MAMGAGPCLWVPIAGGSVRLAQGRPLCPGGMTVWMTASPAGAKPTPLLALTFTAHVFPRHPMSLLPS